MRHADLQNLRAAHDLLNACEPENRLTQLKNLCENNNGTWTVPADPNRYRPTHFHASVFGATAQVQFNALEELPATWIRVASNMLEAEQITQ